MNNNVKLSAGMHSDEPNLGQFPLTEAQRAKFADCEDRIRKALCSYYDIGQALNEIRCGKLYRDQFTTFAEYCKSQWGLTESEAYRHIDAARIIDTLKSSPIREKFVIPEAKSQLLPLAQLGVGDMAEIWGGFLENPPAKKLTAKMVAEKVAALRAARGEVAETVSVAAKRMIVTKEMVEAWARKVVYAAEAIRKKKWKFAIDLLQQLENDFRPISHAAGVTFKENAQSEDYFI